MQNAKRYYTKYEETKELFVQRLTEYLKSEDKADQKFAMDLLAKMKSLQDPDISVKGDGITINVIKNEDNTTDIVAGTGTEE